MYQIRSNRDRISHFCVSLSFVLIVILKEKSENGSKKVFVIPDNKLSVEENKSYFFSKKKVTKETLYQKCNSFNPKKTIFEKKLNQQHGEAVQPHYCIKDIFQK